jgi:hypothetical protein
VIGATLRKPFQTIPPQPEHAAFVADFANIRSNQQARPVVDIFHPQTQTFNGSLSSKGSFEKN